MYRVSGLLIGGRRGFDIKFSGKVVFCHEVFKVELGEWASADVAEANKKYFYHLFISPFKSCISSQTLDISGFSDF